MNWDDEDYEPPTIDENVKAAWDDEDAEESSKEEPAPQPAVAKVDTVAKKKKKELEAKIKEKEEKEAALLEAKKKEQEELDKLQGVEKKLRMQKMVEESDFQNARDIFMDGAAGNDQLGEESIDAMNPKGEDELKRFGGILTKKLLAVQEANTRLQFNKFVKELLRSLSAEMTADDLKCVLLRFVSMSTAHIVVFLRVDPRSYVYSWFLARREMGTHINVLSNEKLQAMKGPGVKKTKGKKKATVKIERSQVMDAYVDDDFDDFM